MRQSRSLGFVATALLALMLAIIAAAANGSGNHQPARRDAGARQLDPVPDGPLFAAAAEASGTKKSVDSRILPRARDEKRDRNGRGDRHPKAASSLRPTLFDATGQREIGQQDVAPKRDACCHVDGAHPPTGEGSGRSSTCCDPNTGAAAQDSDGGNHAVLRAGAHVDNAKSKIGVSARHPLALGLPRKRVDVHAGPARLLPELVL